MLPFLLLVVYIVHESENLKDCGKKDTRYYGTGEKYGRLTAQKKVAGIKPSKWICQCECRNTVTVLQSSIRNGNTKSCGCINKENIAKLQKGILTTHGMTGTREYIAWKDMKARCYNPNNRSYKNYGAKGITVCPTWVNSFEQFYQDMGAAPQAKNVSINRIDRSQNYCKNNCGWIVN